MESRKHQEWRARQQISYRAILSTALFVGGVTFVMSGGSPWSTAGTMNAIVGRDVPWNFFAVLFAHFFASLLYATAIGYAVYRVTVVPAVIIGAAVGLVLSVISREVFSMMGWEMQSPEIRAVLTHLAFGVFGAAVYKGASVPAPLADDDVERHEADAHRIRSGTRRR